MSGISDTISLKISKIRLNKEQLDIVQDFDEEKHVIRGNYGAGKSLVLQRVIKNVAESSVFNWSTRIINNLYDMEDYVK